MTARLSVADRATVADVLRFAGVRVNARGFFLCPVHADQHASAHVIPSGRGWTCFACGARGGILHAAVAFGLANDRAAAARFLEERL